MEVARKTRDFPSPSSSSSSQAGETRKLIKFTCSLINHMNNLVIDFSRAVILVVVRTFLLLLWTDDVFHFLAENAPS